MPELSSLTRPKPTALQIEFGGDIVNVVYDMNAITPATLELSVQEALPLIVSSWDITDEGQPFPPTPENVEKLSYALQRAMVKQLIDRTTISDAEGNASSPSASGQSSDSTPASQISLNGSDSSTLPTASESVVLR